MNSDPVSVDYSSNQHALRLQYLGRESKIMTPDQITKDMKAIRQQQIDQKTSILAEYLIDYYPEDHPTSDSYTQTEESICYDYDGSNIFETRFGLYKILTSEEADIEAIEMIKKSMHLIKPEYIAHYCCTKANNLENIDVLTSAIEMIQQHSHGHANNLLISLISTGDSLGIVSFATETMKCDGRAEYIESRDGKEIEFTGHYSGKTYYIYRMD